MPALRKEVNIAQAYGRHTGGAWIGTFAGFFLGTAFVAAIQSLPAIKGVVVLLIMAAFAAIGLEVIDHGERIPLEEIERITEPFYMDARSRRKVPWGSGSGLTIVKKIVEAHGAALSIESAMGKGTTMRVFFT